ncbi:hypothetical protein Clacol_005751 [Clathrus columnatus]|uniref:Flavin-containing monooxygenase n=1 Tax=Clathrus columnatus TaxID=1419009 RepID=A0AAV5AFT2_9AGAM|nr:hypothetical protein Clacol_005751 [Clathrus columnatus]
MSSPPPSLEDLIQLPTLARLGVEVAPTGINAQDIAISWIKNFDEAVVSNRIDSILALLLEDVLWRDLLSLTWDIRTFFATSAVRSLLEARLGQSRFSNIRISTHKDKPVVLFDSVPGLLWIQAFFDFDCAAGPCTGICRIVPTKGGDWKAHTICTILEEIKRHPFLLGRYRDREPDQSKWKQRRQEESSFIDKDPRVVIVGGGQAGLNVAARLKHLAVPYLIIEKLARIGDGWRNRYRNLSLHDPVDILHLAYLPIQFADWLEFYAKVMDINVWTSSEVSSIQRDDNNDEWIVTVNNSSFKRTLRPKYVILAMGFSVPKYVALTRLGHDIAQDCYETGLDITMIQRSATCIISAKHGLRFFGGSSIDDAPTPVDIADRIAASYPLYLGKRMHQLAIAHLKPYDQALHDGLKKAGFKANWGPEDSGFLLLAGRKVGGYYIDTGASQLIVDGKIKVKGGNIREFNEDGLIFEDESSLTADVIILATGVRQFEGHLFDPGIASKLLPSRAEADGELQWVKSGLRNVYSMAGNIMMARAYSTQIALHIKAKEEGLYTNMYEQLEEW